MQIPDLHTAAAGNLVGWHDAHLRALGFPTQQVDGLWLTTAPVPVIFFSAIALGPGASAGTAAACPPRDHWIAVSDPWGDLRSLQLSLPGRVRWDGKPAPLVLSLIHI